MKAIWTTGDDGDRYMVQCNECIRMWFSPPVSQVIDKFGYEGAYEQTEREMKKLISTICEHAKEEWHL